MYHGSAGRPATPTLHYIGKAELIGIDSPPRHLPRLQILVTASGTCAKNTPSTPQSVCVNGGTFTRVLNANFSH
ncbi:hypothetical protein KEM48_006284 [Puccinia striiformis f. sp. tritici PST-130]|nr:hypothetical protein H4Q26_006267 [Puccinia striiformis f. sp. tritici PST-130]KAI9619372.1 hypothetical protein KEM48_006284 [Puccinia striiformis f. sp. tritici PST-130]